MALVDFVQERREDLFLEALGLICFLDEGSKLRDSFLFVFMIELGNVNLLEYLLDFGLSSLVFLAVVSIENSPLVGSGLQKRRVDEPATLVILDVGANLANDLGITVAVKVVILDLEVGTKRQQHLLALGQVGLGGLVCKIKPERDWQVERVERGLVSHDVHVLVHREFGEVDAILGCGDEVNQLAQFGVESNVVVQLDQVEVVWGALEVLSQENVDAALDDECIIDSNHAHPRRLVPAGVAATSVGGIHDVVSYKEESLQELDGPAQNGDLFVLILGKFLFVENQLVGVNYAEAPVQFAPHCVMDERMLDPLAGLGSKLSLANNFVEFIDNLGENRLKIRATTHRQMMTSQE